MDTHLPQYHPDRTRRELRFSPYLRKRKNAYIVLYFHVLSVQASLINIEATACRCLQSMTDPALQNTFSTAVINRAWVERTRQYTEFKKIISTARSQLSILLTHCSDAGVPRRNSKNTGYHLERYFWERLTNTPGLTTRNTANANVFYLDISPYNSWAHSKQSTYKGRVKDAKEDVRKAAECALFYIRNAGLKDFLTLIVSGQDQGKAMGQYIPRECNTTYIANTADVINKNPSIKLWNPGDDISGPGAIIIGNSKPLTVANRPIFIYFSGSKNSRVRTKLFKAFKQGAARNDSSVMFNRHTGSSSWEKNMKMSRFCLCPGGHGVGLHRLAQAVRSMCIPVLFQDNQKEYFPPYYCMVDWSSVAVYIKFDAIHNTYSTLSRISDQTIQEKLLLLQYIQPFFNFPERDEGTSVSAFNLLLVELNLRRKCDVLGGQKRE